MFHSTIFRSEKTCESQLYAWLRPDADGHLKNGTESTHKHADADKLCKEHLIIRPADTRVYNKRIAYRTIQHPKHFLNTVTYAHTTLLVLLLILQITSLPKVIWEQGRVAAAVPGADWHKGLRIRNVCIVLVKDRCANVRYFSVRKQE